MADFCKQCSLENFNEDFGDLAGLLTQAGIQNENPPRMLVLCEGCGDAIVDDSGTCFAKNCLKKHGDEE